MAEPGVAGIAGLEPVEPEAGGREAIGREAIGLEAMGLGTVGTGAPGPETASGLQAFLARHRDCALVEVAEAKGSTPREAGAWMLVAQRETFGTIGGGQLEWMAIDEARRVLARGGAGGLRDALKADAAPLSVSPSPIHLSPRGGERKGANQASGTSPPLPPAGGEVAADRRTERGAAASNAGWIAPAEAPVLLDIPLGPAIGQCCGGRVRLAVRPVDDPLRTALVRTARAADAARPDVLVFGAGHVGHALARALALLPVRAAVIETRAEALVGLPSGVDARGMVVPEQAVRDARPGSAFVVLTHDHALDFLLAAEALKREDAAYVGMIGSGTKRATFRRWFTGEAGGSQAQSGRLVCPIGGGGVHDKRPAVIAALAAAEVVTALAASRQAPVRRGARREAG